MFRARPTLPLAVLLAIGPALAVAQYRAMAPAVTIALVLMVGLHLLARRSLPWPRHSGVLAAGFALLGWGAVTALWAPEPLRVATGTLSLAGLLVLAAMATRAVMDDTTENLRLLGPALALGLLLGAVLAAFDHFTDNLFRAAIRGFPPVTPQLGFGLKPSTAVLVALLPLLLGATVLPMLVRLGLIATGTAVVLVLTAEASKIAILAALVAVAAAAVVPRLATRLAGFGLAALILASPWLVEVLSSRLPSLAALPPSASHRVLIWDFVAERIAGNRVFGWGFEASREIPGGEDPVAQAALLRHGLTSPELLDFFSRAQNLPLHPHNASLQLWLELGLGGALLGALLAILVMEAVGRGGLRAAGIGAGVSCAVIGQLSFSVWSPWWVATQLLVAVTLTGLASLRRRGG